MAVLPKISHQWIRAPDFYGREKGEDSRQRFAFGDGCRVVHPLCGLPAAIFRPR